MELKFNSDGWTDWVHHDGKGNPCNGYYVQVLYANGQSTEFVSGTLRWTRMRTPHLEAKNLAGITSDWQWLTSQPKEYDIVKYRIRKPKGLAMLQESLYKLNVSGNLETKRLECNT